MPDRLGDFLDNSVPSRHNLVCPMCGITIKAHTSLGARLAMKLHRKHCPVRIKRDRDLQMATVEEICARLDQMSAEVVQAIHGPKAQTLSALAEAVQMLAQSKLAAEEPTSEVAHMLGEGHPGTHQIVEATAHVSSALESVGNLIQEAIARVEEITDSSTTLGFAYQSVAQGLRAGGR